MKLKEQSRLLELKEETIEELKCKNQEILKSIGHLEESSENMELESDKKENENESMKNELNKLKEFIDKVQIHLNVEERLEDQDSNDGLKIRPTYFRYVDVEVSKIVDERDYLRTENEELRDRLKIDEEINKERAETLEEENSVFEKKIIELERYIEVLKDGINSGDQEKNDVQKKLDEIIIVVEEEKKLRTALEENLGEITMEKDDIGKQLGDALQKCDSLNAKLDDEITLRVKTEEKLDEITAERNEVITNLGEEIKIRGQVDKSLYDITTEKNKLVEEKIELYKNYINEKNKRFEIESELAKSEDLIEELRVPKLNCLQVLIPCCFRRSR